MSVWYMPECSYVKPASLDEALKHLCDWADETRIIAGGTDLIPSLRMRLFEPSYLMDIRGIPELNVFEVENDFVRLGAALSLRRLERDPFLQNECPVFVDAIRQVAAPNIRNMGTLGGNICLDTRCHWYNQSYFWRRGIGFCLKKDGTRCHVAPGGQRCWAAFSADTPAVLLPMDAELEIVSPRGERVVPLREFYIHEGRKRLHLSRDELVRAVRIPRDSTDFRGYYFKFRIRQSVDYPLVGVAVLGRKKGKYPDVRIGLTAVNPCPMEYRVPEDVWTEDAEKVIERVAQAVSGLAKPLKTSIHVSMAYRKYLVRVFVRRGLYALLDRPYRPLMAV